MRILIIEDEIIIARFMEQQLATAFDSEVRIAVSSTEVYSIMSDYLPHLIFCDINLNEESDGIQLMEKLKENYVFEVIFITSYDSKAIIERASTVKPANYIIKPVDESQLYACMVVVNAIIDANPQVGQLRDSVNPLMSQLSETEIQILRLIQERHTTKEIADALYLSPSTIKNYRHNICRKLQLKEENNALLKWLLQNEQLIG